MGQQLGQRLPPAIKYNSDISTILTSGKVATFLAFTNVVRSSSALQDLGKIRAEENWPMPGESYSPKKMQTL